jgi:hypothetical protein
MRHRRGASNGGRSVLLQRPLLVRPRKPRIPLPPPLRPLATGKVPSLHEALQRALDSTHGNLQTLLTKQLRGKVLGRKSGPRTTVLSVKVSALGLLTEDNGDPTQNPRKNQSIEEVGNRSRSRHKKIAHLTADGEGLTDRTQLATKGGGKLPPTQVGA